MGLQHLDGWAAFWIIPVWFFGGWALMLLPGAIAAHESAPVPSARRLGLRRIVACVTALFVGAIAFVATLLLIFPHLPTHLADTTNLLPR